MLMPLTTGAPARPPAAVAALPDKLFRNKEKSAFRCWLAWTMLRH